MSLMFLLCVHVFVVHVCVCTGSHLCECVQVEVGGQPGVLVLRAMYLAGLELTSRQGWKARERPSRDPHILASPLPESHTCTIMLAF